MSNKTHACLNCGAHFSGKFCEACGQRTDTRRITMQALLTNDLLRSIFHLETQLLYTLKQLLIRPGHAIREYLQGHRAKFTNFFSLLVIIILVLTWVEQKVDFHYQDLTETPTPGFEGLYKFRSEYPKLVLIGVIPFFAMISYMIFRKARQNYAEHFVLNAYKSCGTLLFTIVLVSSKLFTGDFAVIRRIDTLIVLGIFIYSFVLFYQYFSAFNYQKISLILLCTACTLLPYILIVFLIAGFTEIN